MQKKCLLEKRKLSEKQKLPFRDGSAAAAGGYETFKKNTRKSGLLI